MGLMFTNLANELEHHLACIDHFPAVDLHSVPRFLRFEKTRGAPRTPKKSPPCYHHFSWLGHHFLGGEVTCCSIHRCPEFPLVG